MISPKAELAVFEERRKPSREKPNYMPQSVMEKLEEMGFAESDVFDSP